MKDKEKVKWKGAAKPVSRDDTAHPAQGSPGLRGWTGTPAGADLEQALLGAGSGHWLRLVASSQHYRAEAGWWHKLKGSREEERSLDVL